jgi:hypothetical protein
MAWSGHGAVVQSLVGDFSGTDEVLALAQAGRLESLGEILITRSGRIGPLVELVSGRRCRPQAYIKVGVQAPFIGALERALTEGAIFGLDMGARMGVFPLAHLGPDGDVSDEWTLWFSRADQAAQAAGFPNKTAAMILGAFGELQDNVFRHSQAHASGLIAYAIVDGGFELVVSDQGVGVLGSLRTHPDYAGLSDAGAALRLALANGETRFGRESGSGVGIGQIFRALANQDGDLRFRSDDHVLEIRGHSPSLQGELEVRHKAALPGLTVSLLCRPFGRASNQA